MAIQLKLDVFFIAASIFGIITLAVYATVWITMFRHRRIFRRSYFKLFLFFSIQNVLAYINQWPILRLPLIVCKECTFSEFYEDGSFPGLDIMRFLFDYFILSAVFTEVVMAFNRFTAIRYNVSYNLLWNKIYIPLIILVLIAPIPIAYPALINPSFSLYNEDKDFYYFASNESLAVRGIKLAAVEAGSSVVILSLGFATTYSLWKMPRQVNRSAEVKLFLHCCLTFFIHLAGMTYGVGRGFFPKGSWIYANSTMIVANLLDLANLTSPYILIVCSVELRKRLPSWCCCRVRILRKAPTVSAL